MLGLRLYQLDHDGDLPAALSELAPTYLPTIPSDPMRADGKSFVYLPRATPPILYSVGIDGKDDGGSRAPISNTTSGSRWENRDAIYPLVSEIKKTNS